MQMRFAFAALLLLAFGCESGESSPCQGFADRKLAITGAEYRPCAEQIMAALDSLERPLQALVSNSAGVAERDEARRAYGRLKGLVRQTGIEADYRSLQPRTIVMKWADGDVSAFNSASVNAMIQYMAVLAYPNQDNLNQGVRAHEQARRHYARIR